MATETFGRRFGYGLLGLGLGLAAAAGACVTASTETMSAASIKTDAIAQTYSTLCRVDGECLSIAQFRVRDQNGPTLELAPPARVTINDRAATFHDSRTPNAVLDGMSILTLLPIYKLYKSGSYYYASSAFAPRQVFDFHDGSGRQGSAEVVVRSFAPSALARITKVSELASLAFELKEPLAADEKLTCVLTLNPDRDPLTRTVVPTAKDSSRICNFAGGYDGVVRPRRNDQFLVRIMRAQTTDRLDDRGRMVRISATSELAFKGRFTE